MAANIDPIYSRLANVQWIGGVVTANTTTDLTTGTSYLAFTADATNGGYLQKLRVKPLGTNVITVMRFWINNGSTTGTAANNTMFTELTIPATTASSTAALAEYDVPFNMAFDAGYRVYVTIATGVAAGFGVTAVAGKY